MAITFTWSVKDMHKVTETGAVYKVEWSCGGVDADTAVSYSRSGSYQHMGSVTVKEMTSIKKTITGKDSAGCDIIEIVQVLEDVLKPAPVTPDHTASGFTAYASLTEADVLAWCKAGGVGSKTEALITSNITNKLAAAVNSTGMPWAAE